MLDCEAENCEAEKRRRRDEAEAAGTLIEVGGKFLWKEDPRNTKQIQVRKIGGPARWTDPLILADVIGSADDQIICVDVDSFRKHTELLTQ